MMQGQLSLFDFSEKSKLEKTEQSTINFSCFSVFRSEAGGIKYGECIAEHQCEYCEVFSTFYEKAEEYQRAGNQWGKSVALARRFFGLPTVPEYEVEAY